MANEPTIPDNPESAAAPAPMEDLPPGNHPAEVAARSGFGPLSAKVSDIWHGYSEPCVSCGQLVPRDAQQCYHCEQDLTDEMLEKMRAHAGPWFVLEHVRPFPGVSFERLLRQIQRGVLTATSIVRGPATDYQWRYAVETPGLCLYFEKCWNCHEQVNPTDRFCKSCLTRLAFEQPTANPTTQATPATQTTPATPGVNPAIALAQHANTSAVQTPAQTAAAARTPAPHRVHELADLSAAVDAAKDFTSEQIWDEPPKLFGISVTWLAGIVIVLIIIALMLITQIRQQPDVSKSAAQKAATTNSTPAS